MRTTTSNTEAMSCTARDYKQVKQFQDAYAKSSLAMEAFEGTVLPTGETISTEERIHCIENATGFVDNVIIGTPVRKVQGFSEVVPVNEEGCILMPTDYEFSVRDYVFGASGKTTISVCSQVGDVFEIGKEYTFAASHIDSVYYDSYNVVSQKWILNNEETADDELKSLLNTVRSAPTPRFSKPTVVEKAAPTDAFLNHVDVAVVASIANIYRGPLDSDVFSAKLEVQEIVKGSPAEGVLDDWMRLKGDVSEGETCLILFQIGEDGTLSLSSREGAIIACGDPQFAAYRDLLR